MSSGRKTEILRAQLVSRAGFKPDDRELYELTQLAGVTMDTRVFQILLDLLRLNVHPDALVETLRSMCSHHRGKPVTAVRHSSSLAHSHR